MALFKTDGFDLEAYLARIGFGDEAPAPDLATLRHIALRHPCAIPFENLNPFLRRPVPLDIASIQHKIVRGGRGGWCFEHNLLLGSALTATGFDVTGLAARVLWNVPAGVVRSRTHMVLQVTLSNQPYIVDAGFGGRTLTGPLKLEPGVYPTPHEPFRLSHIGNDWLLEVDFDGGWKQLYTFDLQPQVLADYEMANWHLCNHPESHFLAGLVAARADTDRRFALRNTELTVYSRDGFTERETLSNATAIRRALEELFLIRMPEGEDVDAGLRRVTATQTAAAV